MITDRQTYRISSCRFDSFCWRGQVKQFFAINNVKMWLWRYNVHRVCLAPPDLLDTLTVGSNYWSIDRVKLTTFEKGFKVGWNYINDQQVLSDIRFAHAIFMFDIKRGQFGRFYSDNAPALTFLGCFDVINHKKNCLLFIRYPYCVKE